MHMPRIRFGREGIRPYIAIEKPWGGVLKRHKGALEAADVLLGILSVFFAPPPLNLIAAGVSILGFIGIRQIEFATLETGTAVATGTPLKAELTRTDEDEVDGET